MSNSKTPKKRYFLPIFLAAAFGVFGLHHAKVLKAQTPGLRDLAQPKGFYIGAAESASQLGDASYASVLAREYNLLMPENDMKFWAIHPAKDFYDFSKGDADVAFAQAHGMKVLGGPLIWGCDLPDWVNTGNYTASQLAAILQDHITTVVQHYKNAFPGVIVGWEVVNEAVNCSDIMATIGSSKYDYVALAFRTARAADPSVKLFYNDASGVDVMYNLVAGLKSQGVPIDAIGDQYHLFAPPFDRPTVDITTEANRFGGLGLDFYITELDVSLKTAADGLTPLNPSDLNAQRTTYEALLKGCLASAYCKVVQTWNFTDKYSWIPHFYPGHGAALPFDANYNPKPAYFGLQTVLGGTTVAPPPLPPPTLPPPTPPPPPSPPSLTPTPRLHL